MYIVHSSSSSFPLHTSLRDLFCHSVQHYIVQPFHDLVHIVDLISDHVGIPYVIFTFTRGNKEVIGRLGVVAGQLRVMEECRKVAAKDLIEGHRGR
jgi:hypothetical protein